MTSHLIVIGAQRCGTTYLYNLLDAHPQVAMARPVRPEPKVFLSDRLADKGRSWYVATYFGHATDEKVFGEKSTSYIEDPSAPARIARVLGPTQILVMLRDPVQRAVSNWRFSTDHGFEKRPLDIALRDNLSGSSSWDPDKSSVSPFAYLERGRYADYLQPWLEVFPQAVHVQFLGELDSALGQVYQSIGVDPTFRPAHQAEPVNASREPVPAIPSTLVTRLRDYFSKSDQTLRQWLGRPLPWQSSE